MFVGGTWLGGEASLCAGARVHPITKVACAVSPAMYVMYVGDTIE